MKLRKSELHHRAGQRQQPPGIQCVISGGKYGPHDPAYLESLAPQPEEPAEIPRKRLSNSAAWLKGIEEGDAIVAERRLRGPSPSPYILDAPNGAHPDDPCYADLTPGQKSALNWCIANRKPRLADRF